MADVQEDEYTSHKKHAVARKMESAFNLMTVKSLGIMAWR
jgi:hypothetical protein